VFRGLATADAGCPGFQIRTALDARILRSIPGPAKDSKSTLSPWIGIRVVHLLEILIGHDPSVSGLQFTTPLPM
jgi:hypothetical protein